MFEDYPRRLTPQHSRLEWNNWNTELQHLAPNLFPRNPGLTNKNPDLIPDHIKWYFDPYNPHNPFGPFYEPYVGGRTIDNQINPNGHSQRIPEQEKILDDAARFYVARSHGCHPTVDLTWNPKPDPYSERNHCHMEDGPEPSILMETYLQERGCFGLKDCWNKRHFPGINVSGAVCCVKPYKCNKCVLHNDPCWGNLVNPSFIGNGTAFGTSIPDIGNGGSTISSNTTSTSATTGNPTSQYFL